LAGAVVFGCGVLGGGPLTQHRRRDIALALNRERHQRPADRDLLTRFAVQGRHYPGDRRGDFHRRLVRHDVGQDLVFLDRIPDLHMPADQLGFRRAFADVGQFEDVVALACSLDRRGRRGRGFGLDLGLRRGLRHRLGRGRVLRIPCPLDLELDQRTAHGDHGAGLAVQGDDLAGHRGGDLDRGLVGHDVGDDLVLGDDLAELDVPADQFGLGGALADVRQFEDETTHISDLPS
jgi:hypothetical protein